MSDGEGCRGNLIMDGSWVKVGMVGYGRETVGEKGWERTRSR